MKKKDKTIYICQECGRQSYKWTGKCTCGAWNSYVEEKIMPDEVVKDSRRRGDSSFSSIKEIVPHSIGIKADNTAHAVPIKNINADKNHHRINTCIGELNRVLGGGIVKGSLTLISGEPGIGKSTLIMETANNIACQGLKVLYVSGEESTQQLSLRAKRICEKISDNFLVLSETNMEVVSALINELNINFLIIDSIQTMYSAEFESVPGSISQVRACGNLLMSIGKTLNIPVFIVAHVTKSGELAGPKVLEHLVDCVLHFTGERNKELRILRAFKNRFGTISEIGAFQMEEAGLVEVNNLSNTFLDPSETSKEGSIIGAVYEGTRPLLLEIQALTAYTNMNFPRRTSIGIDANRLNMIIAVLERKCSLNLNNQDVYLNIVGGLKPDGTYMDLPAALAIYSSFKSKRPDSELLVLGEIGLTGSLRTVPHVERIAKEASRLGFKKLLVPAGNKKTLKKISGLEIIGADSLKEAICLCMK